MISLIAKLTPLWLANLIRYLMLKLMKRMRMPDDGRPVIATTRHIAEEFLLPSSFDLFNDIEFRRAAKFSQLPQSEHDRIFNELIVSALAVAMLGVARAEALVKPEDYHFWREASAQLPKQFERVLRDFGVKSENVKQYRELIALRYREYEQLGKQIWETFIDEDERKFRELPLVGREIMSWVQAVAIGTADHIKRDKLNPEDPLLYILRM